MANSFYLSYDVCATAIATGWRPHASFWLNFSTVALLIAGILLAFRRDKSQPGDHSLGVPWLLSLGPVFFALPLAIFGMQHFAEPKVVVGAVPRWMPDRPFWVYFVGAALIAAALSLITGKMARLAALLTGIMLFLFVLMLHVPNLWMNPGDRFALATLFRDLSLSAAAVSFAATLSNARSARWLAIIGRYIFAVAMILFGVEHFPHPQFAPGVPLEMMMPNWMPGHIAWAWVTGAVLIVCGACLLLNQRARTAAVVLGLLFLGLVIFVYLPMEIVHPSTEISGELDFVADTLIFSGASFFIAGSLSRKTAPGLIVS